MPSNVTRLTGIFAVGASLAAVGISTYNSGVVFRAAGTAEWETGSGYAITIQGTDSYILGDLGVGHSTDPEGKLEVLGTISGTTLATTSELNVLSGATFDTNTLYINAGTNRVGIVTVTPSTALDVVGTISGSALRINGEIELLSGATIDTTTLYVNAGANRVGILTAAPENALEVAGTASGDVLRGATLTGHTLNVTARPGVGSGKIMINGSDGGGICFQDNDGAGWTICNALNGVLSCSIANATTCP